MAELLKLKSACKVPFPEKLFEGYETDENYIYANVGTDKIRDIMLDFIKMHDEPLFFILEIPTNRNDEEKPSEILHKDIYYMDGCTKPEAAAVLDRAGEILYNDGLSSFGYGCHESGDEIMFTKYNILTIFSKDITGYNFFFEAHDIHKCKLVTAWDTFSEDHPGETELYYGSGGKTVYDIPEMFKEWGMYFAERRETD